MNINVITPQELAGLCTSKRRYRKFKVEGAPDPASGSPTPARNGHAPINRAAPELRKQFRRDYRAWLWPYRSTLVVIFILAFITTSLDMVWPLAMKYVVDLLPKTDLDRVQKVRLLSIYAIKIVSLLVAKQALDTFRGWWLAVFNAKLTFKLRKRLFQKLLNLPLAQLSDMKSGGVVSRLSGDVDNVSGLVELSVINPAVAGVRVILTISFVLALSPRLALTALLLLPPLTLVSFVWLKKVRPIYRSIREDRSTIDSRVVETFGGIRIVRAFRREPREELNYATGHHTVIRKALYAEVLEMVLRTVWGLLIPGISVVIVTYGGLLVLQGRATIGDLLAFQIYAVMLIQPVWQLVSSVSQTQRSLAAMERVFEVLSMKSDKPDKLGAVSAPQPLREFRFDNVTFEYRPGVPVVKDFSLTVPAGATVALVGPSGAGKTTVTDLVARFHDPTKGSIHLNGADLRDLKLASYRRLLAVVQQEVFLFDGTVRQNIEYGLRGATDEMILDAAKRANAHEFIDRLPDKYDTIIGERGFKLSGGQRQRLSIARAILANPQILILDEATSNLDTESEQLIQASLAELFEGRTTFVIAHRLSTITHADIIVVMESGAIVETGTHDALMLKRGLYFDMVERQRQSMGVEAADSASLAQYPGRGSV